MNAIANVPHGEGRSVNAAMTPLRLSADQRSRLRKAITSHQDWKVLRVAKQYNSADMGVDELREAALALGIDIEAAIAERAYGENTSQDAMRDALNAMYERRREEHDRMNQPKTPDSSIDTAAAQIAAILGNLQPKAPTLDLEQVKRDILDTVAGDLTGWFKIEREIFRGLLDEAVSAIGTVRIELKQHNGEVKQIPGTHHPQFATLMRVLTARQANGFSPSVWIAGPAGSGKTYAAHTAAKTLDLAFHINGALGMAHELMGFIDAGGSYHTTPFRQAYEHGGVYLFDEVDGSDNSALLALNAALANSVCSFPDKAIERHPDCHIMAAANTWGIGATADYVGRAKIDAAFLSRFPVRLSWDYDQKLEQAICGNPSFAKRVQAARRKARAAGIKVLIDPRASIAGAALIAAGMTEDEAAQLTYLANLNADQRRAVEE